MKFGKLVFDPSKNPAVLDTGTWDPAAAWRVVRRVGERWALVQERAIRGQSLPRCGAVTVFAGSCVRLTNGGLIAAVLRAAAIEHEKANVAWRIQ